MSFSGGVVENGLFAKKGISLVVDILHDLGSGATVLHAERACCWPINVLVVEVRDVVCIISAARWQLVLLVVRIALQGRNIIKRGQLRLLLIYRL